MEYRIYNNDCLKQLDELEEKEEFRVFGLKVCETITIKGLDEIEVF